MRQDRLTELANDPNQEMLPGELAFVSALLFVSVLLLVGTLGCIVVGTWKLFNQ